MKKTKLSQSNIITKKLLLWVVFFTFLLMVGGFGWQYWYKGLQSNSRETLTVSEPIGKPTPTEIPLGYPLPDEVILDTKAPGVKPGWGRFTNMYYQIDLPTNWLNLSKYNPRTNSHDGELKVYPPLRGEVGHTPFFKNNNPLDGIPLVLNISLMYRDVQELAEWISSRADIDQSKKDKPNFAMNYFKSIYEPTYLNGLPAWKIKDKYINYSGGLDGYSPLQFYIEMPKVGKVITIHANLQPAYIVDNKQQEMKLDYTKDVQEMLSTFKLLTPQ